MHLLLTIGLGLAASGAVVLAIGLARAGGAAGQGRGLVIVGASAATVSLVIFQSLALAEPAVCAMLGGRYNHSDAGCMDEWGGNGDNDPSDNSSDPWPWTN